MNPALSITEFRPDLLEKYENLKSSLYIVTADVFFTLLGKSVTNMFVLHDIGLRFKRRLAPYALGQCRIPCTAHTSREQVALSLYPYFHLFPHSNLIYVGGRECKSPTAIGVCLQKWVLLHSQGTFCKTGTFGS